MCWVALSALVLPFLVPLAALVILLPCCPKRLKQKTGATLVRYLLPFRYEVRVKGFGLLPNDQGALFLPNHPALMDPIILISYLTRRFKVRPLAAEVQVQKKPWFFGLADALPVPTFSEGTNSFTKHVMKQVLDDTVQTLEGGKCILMYPAGRLMQSGVHFTELGTSAAFDVVSRRRAERPWRVVLVHIHGLWGSRFSTAYSTVTPDFVTELRSALWDLFASFIFFMPKRIVDISFEEVELPALEDKVQLNRWLMSKYNAGGDEQLLKPGDDGYVKGKGRVPYRCCRQDSVRNLDAAASPEARSTEELDPKVVQRVTGAMAKHLGVPQESLAMQKSLAQDLGMDSIQLGELIGWLDLEFNVQDVSATELSTVASIVEIVSGRGGRSAAPSSGRPAPAGWEEKKQRPGLAVLSESQTIGEAFIRNAKRMGSTVMAGDDASGVITYDRALVGAMLFANFLLKHPERISQGRVGVMMPAAAPVSLIVLGVMLAGCAPVMINWTVGRTSLEHVLASTGIKTVITAMRFLKKLGPEVDLSPLLEREGLILFTEDLKANKFGGFGKAQKLGALLAARKSAAALMKRYALDKVSGDSEAVVLFTSGSENYPKGVPLSHGNLLSNIHGVLECAQVRTSDCVFGVLPPFHSFGFTVTTVGPAISGLKAAYYPNPTEYRKISREVARWKPTIYLGTPTFANGILQAAQADREKAMALGGPAAEPQQRKSAATVAPLQSLAQTPWPTASLRLLVTGAEKTPEALFEFVRNQHSPPIDIIEGYGITETSPVLAANRPGKPRHGVGWTIPQTALALLNIEKYLMKDMEVVAHCSAEHRVEGATLTEGVIIAQGPGVFGAMQADPPRAYLGIPLSEKNPFVWVREGWWYDTGDLGFFDETGAVHLSGRLKRFVKIAGEMVSLVSLEAALKLRESGDGSKPWADSEEGPVVAVEAYEVDGEKPVLGLIAAVDGTLEDANAQLQAAGMPKIARLTALVDSRTTFEERWAKQGTLPLLGTGKTDYAQMKRALADVVKRA